MKSESIVIDVFKPIIYLPVMFPDWFESINSDVDKYKVSTYIIDSLIYKHIDMLTEHPLKLYKETPISLSDGKTLDIDMEMILNGSTENIISGITDLYDFVYDYSWFIYDVLKTKNMRVIVRTVDWRVKEYYRLTNKVDKTSLCLDEWTDDFTLINEFINKN
jgi:hypothetical protein